MNKKSENVTLKTMDDVVAYLSDNVNKVSYDVDNINIQFDEVQNQVNNMQNNVRSLEDEIRAFMKEMKQNALINSAKQSIMLSQMEFEKKYKHRDEVRRRTLGLLQSIDINLIKKSTMETISEETIVSNPDYWLAPALVAICHWYGNNKELAKIALQKALDRSVEKTSLLFCLIHLRAGRMKTAAKWLEGYLKLQDPTNMDCKIILILDALCSGIFNQEMTDIIINQIEIWKSRLNNYPQYEKNQIPKWEEYFKEQQSVVTQNQNQFINLFVKEKEKLNNVISFSRNHNQVITSFKENLNSIEDKYNDKQSKIDRLIDLLIFDYEKEELELKLEIDNNNNIINSSNEYQNNNYENNANYIKTDFYTHISNMCFNSDNLDINTNTKKLAFCISKEHIIEAYKKAYKITEELELPYLNIMIDDWLGTTKDGSNEFELKENITNYVEKIYQQDIDKSNLISIDMIISMVVTLLMIILCRKNIVIIILLIIASLIYNGYKLYQNYKKKRNLEKLLAGEKKSKNELITCTIVEIVDYYFILEETKEIKDKFIKYLETLNPNEYIKVYRDNNRNIMIGGKQNGK